MVIVKLKLSDGVVFETDTEVLKYFDAMKPMLADLDTDSDDQTFIKIPSVSSNTMGLVLEWAERYQKSLNEPSVDEPIAADKEAPVNAPVDAPVNAPVEVPVDVPVDAPMDAPVDAPVDAPLNAPVDAPVDAPVNEPIVGNEKGAPDNNQMAVDDPDADGEHEVNEDENVLPIIEAAPKPKTNKEWEQGFLNTDKQILFDIILAANYLGIKPLLDVACDKVASSFKRRSTEETLRYFNITNDCGKDK